MVRLSASSAERRIDTLLARYQRHRRGMALWISPSATPANVTDLLTARRLRCQKYYPAMIRNLADRPSCQQPKGLGDPTLMTAQAFHRPSPCPERYQGRGIASRPDRACLPRYSRSGCGAHRTARIDRGPAAICAQGIP
jgi:hypothetical protein